MGDFDVARRGGAYDPPHLIGGNPLAMKRDLALIVSDAEADGVVALEEQAAPARPAAAVLSPSARAKSSRRSRSVAILLALSECL